MDLIHSMAALLWSAAVLLLALTGMSHLVGATDVARRFGSCTATAIFVGLALELLADVLRGIPEPLAATQMFDGTGGTWLCWLVGGGHVVLGIALLARRFAGGLAERDVAERARGRVRERTSAEVRRDEVE